MIYFMLILYVNYDGVKGTLSLENKEKISNKKIWKFLKLKSQKVARKKEILEINLGI